MRESSLAGTVPACVPEHEATVELELLEQTARTGETAATGENPYGLQPDPIPREWILEGTPTARRRMLVGSSDDRSSTHMWECTGGRFNWEYNEDEVIHVLEGSVVIEDEAGVRRRLVPGDTFLFPAGTRFHWTVAQYIRKIAFLHAPLSRKMRLAQRIYGLFKRERQPAAWTG